MYKDFRYINAGENEIYRYGKKAVEKASAFLEERNGYYSFPVDGGKYWTIGTSNGKYGEFMKFGDVIFSVNKGGFAYAKAGTEKGEKFSYFRLYSFILRNNFIIFTFNVVFAHSTKWT